MRQHRSRLQQRLRQRFLPLQPSSLNFPGCKVVKVGWVEQSDTHQKPVGYGLWPYPSLGTYGEVAFAGLSARALTTAGAVNTGIGLAVNGTFQLASDKPFDFIDFGVAGATAFATTGTSFLPTLYINTLGAYGGSVVKWENLTASMAGASLGTLVGFPLGKGTEQILTRYLGQSMTTDSIGAFASSIGQEYVGNKVKTTIEQQNK